MERIPFDDTKSLNVIDVFVAQSRPPLNLNQILYLGVHFRVLMSLLLDSSKRVCFFPLELAFFLLALFLF